MYTLTHPITAARLNASAVRFEGVTFSEFLVAAKARSASCPCSECKRIEEEAIDIFCGALTSTAGPLSEYESDAAEIVRALCRLEE